MALNDAGEVEVYLGITTMGQGHETVMAQICADSLGAPIEEVRVYHGSTDYLPASVGTFGSRASVMASNAIHLTCQTLKAKILAVAAGYLDTEPQIHHQKRKKGLVGAGCKAGYDGKRQNQSITNEVQPLWRREPCLSSTRKTGVPPA